MKRYAELVCNRLEVRIKSLTITKLKYKCIRCLDDKRVNDGAVVSLDQCLSCTRYEPIAGQVYAILDDSGTNITQVIDDMQMAYMDTKDYVEFTRVEEYRNTPNPANVKTNNQSETPEPFIKNIWKDSEKELKEKIKDKIKDKTKEEIKKIEEEEKSGFVMSWTPSKLELQNPNISEYDAEAITLNKPLPEQDSEELAPSKYVDTRGDAASYEEVVFNISDYEFSNFGKNSESSGGSSSAGADARNKIVEYCKKAAALCAEGKVRYSRENRWSHEGQKGSGPLNGLSYWDCSSLVYDAYANAGIILGGEVTQTQYPLAKDQQGGLLIPLGNIAEARPGDILYFSKATKPTTKEGLNAFNNKDCTHVGIYIGDNKYIDTAREHDDPKEDLVEHAIGWWKGGEMCFGRPKALIDLDNQGGSIGDMSEQWSREYHGINDELWNTANVVVGQCNNFPSQMKKWNYKHIIIEESKKANFDPYIVAALIAVESNGDPRDNDAYAGLMQVHGHYGSTTEAGMRDNIKCGIAMYKAKMTTLKQNGWKEENIHVLLSAYNSGEGCVVGAAKSASLNLADVKIPALGNALKPYVQKTYPSWNSNEKRQYATKILRAYNLLYEKNVLELAREKGFIRPVPHAVSSPWGMRLHPIQGVQKMHHGVDFSSPGGYSIKATASGKVTAAGVNGGYGNCVDIAHAGGKMSRYAHMQSITCKLGDQIKQGDEVGKVGTTGGSTGNHLHFEIRQGQNSEDPMKYIPK